MSHPSRVRGLKQDGDIRVLITKVAPLAGAWIETLRYGSMIAVISRTPRGCED